MKDLFLTILNEYPKIHSFAELLNHEAHNIITRKLPEQIKSYLQLNSEYTVKGHDGNGNKAAVPWIGIHYNALSPSPSEGIYIAILFSAEGNYLNISLQQGTEDLNFSEIQKRTAYFRKKYTDLLNDEKRINLESENTRPRKYKAANLSNIILRKTDITDDIIFNALNTVFKKYKIITDEVKNISNYNYLIQQKQQDDNLFSMDLRESS